MYDSLLEIYDFLYNFTIFLRILRFPSKFDDFQCKCIIFSRNKRFLSRNLIFIHVWGHCSACRHSLRHHRRLVHLSSTVFVPIHTVRLSSSIHDSHLFGYYYLLQLHNCFRRWEQSSLSSTSTSLHLYSDTSWHLGSSVGTKE